MEKQTLISGVRATSQPHIGNYLGAIKQFIDLQDKYDSHYFIADLHSLTSVFEPKELRKNILEVAADYIALGLNPNKSTLFIQSQVPEHAELSWVLTCITPIGELQRMTQFKEKSEQQKEKSNAGLLNYPVLMAADVLVYKAHFVPVGEDQVQHLELARVLARKFNNTFGKVFPEPKPILTKTARVKSLMDPEKKMSKTGDEALLLSDSPEEIKRKLKKAVTATDAKGKSAGVENLFLLLREFGSKEEIQYFENGYADNTIKFSELKEALAKDISDYFAEFREKRKELLGNPTQLVEILAEGARKAEAKARETMLEVKRKTGLL